MATVSRGHPPESPRCIPGAQLGEVRRRRRVKPPAGLGLLHPGLQAHRPRECPEVVGSPGDQDGSVDEPGVVQRPVRGQVPVQVAVFGIPLKVAATLPIMLSTL